MSILEGVVATLTRQANEHREQSREYGIAYTGATPAEEQAAGRHGAAIAAREAAERALRDAEEALATARAAEDQARREHEQAQVARAAHLTESRQYADIAESLEQLAAVHRQKHTPDADPPADAPAPNTLAPDADPLAFLPGMGRDSRRDIADVIAARTGGVPVVQDAVIVATGGPTCTIPDAGAVLPAARRTTPTDEQQEADR